MEAFTKGGIVPDMLDHPPPAQLQVSYNGVSVRPGDVLTPTQVKDSPVVTWQGQPAAFYTLIMDDPDAPSRADPKFGDFNHWLVTNIAGSNLAQGDVMTAYIGSGPPQGTGLHRYVFLLYQQPGRLTYDSLTHISDTCREGRRCWKVRQFSAKYGLGNPVAGNFYQAEYDDYVPNIHRQLGLGK